MFSAFSWNMQIHYLCLLFIYLFIHLLGSKLCWVTPGHPEICISFCLADIPWGLDGAILGWDRGKEELNSHRGPGVVGLDSSTALVILVPLGGHYLLWDSVFSPIKWGLKMSGFTVFSIPILQIKKWLKGVGEAQSTRAGSHTLGPPVPRARSFAFSNFGWISTFQVQMAHELIVSWQILSCLSKCSLIPAALQPSTSKAGLVAQGCLGVIL